eukprot:scaffold12249_cov214-Amphora_coffeaeformis.AAC.2
MRKTPLLTKPSVPISLRGVPPFVSVRSLVNRYSKVAAGAGGRPSTSTQLAGSGAPIGLELGLEEGLRLELGLKVAGS